jgi:hypothetical protein
VLFADCAAKLIREFGSHAGIGEAPPNVVASIFVAAASVLDLYAVAGVKQEHGIDFRVKASFRDVYFHNVRISSLGSFRSRAIVWEHCSNRKCVTHLSLRTGFDLVI